MQKEIALPPVRFSDSPSTELRAAASTPVDAHSEDFTPIPRRDWAALLLVGSVFAVLLERCAAAAGDMQLFADGSWFLVRIASTHSWYFWIVSWRDQWFQSRASTILIEEAPTVLFTHLPVYSLHALSVIFGATLYAHALIGLYVCYRYAARKWYCIFPLLSLFAGSMNSEALICSDSHFVISLYWPTLFILLFRRQFSRGDRVLLVLLSVPLLLSYESVIFFGVILAAVCVWRWRKFESNRLLMLVLAVWYLLSAGVALASILHPFDPTNKSGFLKGLLGLWRSDLLAAKTSIVVLLCCAVLMATSRRVAKIQWTLVAIAGLATLYLLSQVLIGHAPVTLNTEMQARVMNLVVPLASSILLLAVWSGILRPDFRAVQLIGTLIAFLGFAQAFNALGFLMQWRGVLATLRYELLLKDGPIPYSDSIMARPELGKLRLADDHATWPLLPLSLYASEAGNVKSVIVTPPGTYFPFDPLAPQTFPNLFRYGVHYEAYAAALARDWQYAIGQTLTFQNGGSATQFEAGGWSHPEAWATWSEGQDFGLKLPLRNNKVPKPVFLEAQVVPNLSANHPHSSVEVSVNGVRIGIWQFDYTPEFAVRSQRAEVPADALARQNPVIISFHMREPVLSPSEMGKANDPRKLGLAFLKVGLYEH